MPNVAIRLLGGFSAAVDGEEVGPRAWRLKKARELVKLLALAPGHRLHREQAMDALWRDYVPGAAANNLYQAVHAARRALGPDTISVGDEIVALAGDVEVDVDRFERAAALATRERTATTCRAALALYTGDLLPENRYDEWAETRRRHLEDVHEALRRELARLPESPGPGGLPADASSFVGRGHELAELRSVVGRTRLLTLTGTGGAGKTRLALELARGEQARFADGAVLVPLATLTDPAIVPVAVAAALDVRALGGQALRDAIGEFLASRTLLLVLDNCEHLIGASAELVDSIMRGAPGVTVLATSREPLRVPGEVVFRVPSLAMPSPEQPLTPEDALRYEAIRLFVDRAEAAAPAFVLDSRNVADVARICFRLDGLPLAVELAAGRLGALSASSIAERLDDRFRLLQAGSRTAPTRQQTLLATLQWSHDLLDEEERVLFRRLAVFAGGFDLDAAELVCTDDLLEEPDVANLLARLVEKSLVSAGETDGEWRYDLLETVRAYAHERLAESEETAGLRRRHAAWATALGERERGSVRLDREAANLRSALATLLAEDPQGALRLCVAIWPFWLRRIDLAEAERRFVAALAAAPERSTLRIEALLAAAAFDMRSGTLANGITRAEEALAIASELGDARSELRAYQLLGEYAIASDAGEDAEAWLERGLVVARREGFCGAEALCIYSLGVARWILGDLEGADALLADSLERFRAVDDPGELVSSPQNIGDLRGEPGDPSNLRVVFEETLQPYIEVTCSAAAGYVLANRASIARMRGDFDSAERLLAECTQHFDALDDDHGRASALVRTAYLRLAEGDVDAARMRLERALEIRTSLNERREVGLVLSGLGLVETIAGNFDAAEVRLGDARQLFRRAGDRWGLASSLWRTAELWRAEGRLDDAWSALQEAREILTATNRPRWIGHAEAALAEVASLRGDREQAASLFASALEQYRVSHDTLGQAAVERQLEALAKTAQSSRKDARVTTTATRSRKRRTP
ncbi:MAG TPA: AAA family ATPase [Gaiellaceae bacterium]|nr:AAA family ATPase [Gaiellaceae bacterium]